MSKCSMCRDNDVNGQGYCKPCAVIYSRQWRSKNRERSRELSRRANIKHTFGISSDEYDLMKLKAGDYCVICEQHGKQLVLDHKHQPHRVRQFICDGCNGFIGHLEKPGRLEKALEYLKKHEVTTRKRSVESTDEKAKTIKGEANVRD